MDPALFADAAAAVARNVPLGQMPAPVQGLLRGMQPGPGLLPMLRMAARARRIFALRPPSAPGAVFVGASFDFGSGAASHVAGLGPGLQDALARAMNEAAEAGALARLRAGAATEPLPLLDAQGVVTRRLAAFDPAEGRGIAAGTNRAQVALSAVCEAVERHAIAVWISGAEQARAVPEAAPLRRFETALRGGAPVRPARFLLLPSGFPGFAVVAAVSGDAGGGPLVGYGCAPDPMAAACKALTELVMAEVGLMLEVQANAEGRAPPPDGFSARMGWFAARPALTTPERTAPWPEAGPPMLDQLAEGAGLRVGLVDLTGEGAEVAVLMAVSPGLHDLRALVPIGAPGPV